MILQGFSTVALIVLLDQLSKYWVVHHLMSTPQVIEVTPFFNIVMVWNRGASFGLFSSGSEWSPIILGGLAIVVSLFLTIWLIKSKSRYLSLALGLVIGGALGNVIDRVIYRAVADFLDFHVAGYHWPSFNVADIAITLGVVMLLFDGLKTGRRDNKLSP